MRFIRSRPHKVEPLPDSGNLMVHFTTAEGRVLQEEFDLVVLSVGLQTSPETLALAERLKVELNSDRFARTSPFRPVETSRRGIFVCGAFQGPKDIPVSVMEASAAAAECGELLAAVRGTRCRR